LTIEKFLSEGFIYATLNHCEMICVLALSGLSFEPGLFDLKPAAARKICNSKFVFIGYLFYSL
jgi:hypothetical protein